MRGISRDIIANAAKGDIKAFEEVYKMYSGFVFNVAFRVACNKEDAAEVTQDVFFKVYHKLKDFRFESSFKTWVYRIAVNLAINHAKKTSKEKHRMVEYDDNIQSVEADALKDMEKEDIENALNKLIYALSPEQRACIVLRHIEGLRYEEIASALKVNINTVRTRLKRAREKLLVIRKEAATNEV